MLSEIPITSVERDEDGDALIEQGLAAASNFLSAPDSAPVAMELLFEPLATVAKALKARLNKLLINLTRENFRDVAADITQSINSCYERLQALGSERSSKFEQRSYLLKTATSFQYLVSHALDAYYGRDAVFADHDELRLATVVKGLQEDFSRDIVLGGQAGPLVFLSIRCIEQLNNPNYIPNDCQRHFNISILKSTRISICACQNPMIV
jgi:hypothetical protein